MTGHEFQTPVVHEAVVFREAASHDDFIEEFENTKAPGGAYVPYPDSWPPDYSRQLQFHKDELAQAEQRGFPPGQISYHVEKVRALGQLINNIIEVDFVERVRL